MNALLRKLDEIINKPEEVSSKPITITLADKTFSVNTKSTASAISPVQSLRLSMTLSLSDMYLRGGG